MTQYLHNDSVNDKEKLSLEDVRAMILEAEKGPFQDGPTVMQEIRVEIAQYASSRKHSA
jgi:hypothetical protein